MDEISGFVTHIIEFGEYTEREKEALRQKYKIKEFSKEEKELLYAYRDLSMELQGEKGYMTPEESKELDKRFQAYLKERMSKNEE